MRAARGAEWAECEGQSGLRDEILNHSRQVSDYHSRWTADFPGERSEGTPHNRRKEGRERGDSAIGTNCGSLRLDREGVIPLVYQPVERAETLLSAWPACVLPCEHLAPVYQWIRYEIR